MCSAEAMVEICNIDELNVWMDDCECKAWNDFFSYPDLLVVGCMVLYDIVPDFIQFMLTLSFKIRYKRKFEQLNLFLDMLSIRSVILFFFFIFISVYMRYISLVCIFQIDGMMEYKCWEIGWLLKFLFSQVSDRMCAFETI